MIRSILTLLFILLMSLPVVAESRQVNPWAYRNDALQGQAQGRRPWAEVPADNRRNNVPVYSYQLRPDLYSPGYSNQSYYRPGYGYPYNPYDQGNHMPYGIPVYPGSGYLPGMSDFSYPGLGW